MGLYPHHDVDDDRTFLGQTCRMTDAMLDYGAPDGAEVSNPVEDQGEVHLQDASMDAEMQDWEERYDGTADEYAAQRQRKLEELKALRMTNKFYALPRDQAVEAGARRGVVARPVIADDVLMGDEVSNEPAPETPGTIGQGLDIRYNALHMTGLPITQCSTSRLFAYITHFGAQPLGLEWINDQSCNVVFSDAAAARLALEYLCPTAAGRAVEPDMLPLPSEQEMIEAANVKRVHDSGIGAQAHDWPETFMQSILQPRKAHRIPGVLYNAPERDAVSAMQEFHDEQASKRNVGSGTADISTSEVPEIYREMDEEDRQRFSQTPAQTALHSLRSNLWLRWTVESYDVKGNRSAVQSKWYRDHGRDAGKEVVAKVLHVGGPDERLELLPDSSSGGLRRARGRGTARNSATMDELDREMDAYRDRADDAVVGGNSEARRRRRRGSRSAVTMAALDEEMELDRRDRSASPVRRSNGGDESSIKVRGRGRMRAPSAWDDDRNGGDDGNRYRRERAGREAASSSFDLAHRLRMPASSDHTIQYTRSGGSEHQRSLTERLAVAGSAAPKQRNDLLDRIH